MKTSQHIVESLIGEGSYGDKMIAKLNQRTDPENILFPSRLSKREKARIDAIAITDPHQAEAETQGGRLFRPNLPSRDAWNAMLAKYAPGCGSPTTLPGTNGGEFPCGGRVNGKQEFCPHCQ